MTEQEATRLFEKWRKILHLEAWDIKFQWCVRGRDMNLQDCMGCTSFLHESHQAIVQMLDPVDFDNDLFSYDYEKTLVHELLHLRFSDLENSAQQAGILSNRSYTSRERLFFFSAKIQKSGLQNTETVVQ